MSQEIVLQPQPRAWLEDSILQPYVSRYGAHLRRGRYAPSTQRVYLCCVAHFAHWLTGERCGLTALDEAVIARFLSEHLSACGCPYPVRRLRHELRAALAQLLDVLRSDGVGAPDPALDTAVTQELARFDAHMRDVWGLADSTRRRRGRVVGEFLSAHFGDQPVTMSKISIASARRFVLGEHGSNAGSIAVIGGAIRCYLRFRSMSGDRISELAAAIPRVAHWRLTSLPEVLTDAEIDQLLRSFDQPFPSRRRAYAMTRCLIDLGLRSSEVVGLRLEDINWTDGTLCLVGTKGRRADVLPLGFDLRIHDLRHTFICRRVQLWHEHGADIGNAMAALSTYVGHAKVSDTYWYLTGVPDLMALAGERFELFAAPVGEGPQRDRQVNEVSTHVSDNAQLSRIMI